MNAEDRSYVETKMDYLINKNFSIAGVLTMKLIKLIYKVTDGNPIRFMSDSADIEMGEYEDEVFNIQEISKETLLGLLELMLQEK